MTLDLVLMIIPQTLANAIDEFFINKLSKEAFELITHHLDY
jgi:hypothetical protein